MPDDLTDSFERLEKTFYETREDPCQRHMVRRDGKKFYFLTTHNSIMFSAEREGDIANQEDYSTVNTICRLSSKLRGLGMSWKGIYHQIDAGSMGNPRTWPAMVAQVIKDNCW